MLQAVSTWRRFTQSTRFNRLDTRIPSLVAGIFSLCIEQPHAHARSWLRSSGPELALASPSPNRMIPDRSSIPDSQNRNANVPLKTESIEPPRIDGAYLGPSLHGFVLLPQIDSLKNQASMFGGSAWIHVGEVVLPWLSIGVLAGGGMAFEDPQKATQWGFLVEFGFYPTPRYPWSIRTSFGTGGGAIRDPRKPNKRFGYGGAVFQAGVRYEWFPMAAQNRSTRGGGWAIGPEFGWLGFPPSAKGKDMAHSPYGSLTTSFYFGR